MKADDAFSAALCRGLIEAHPPAELVVGGVRQFSAALCRGLIEAASTGAARTSGRRCFPRLYAAASLKPYDAQAASQSPECFPRLYAAASLKHAEERRNAPALHQVFRGFMPRPH